MSLKTLACACLAVLATAGLPAAAQDTPAAPPAAEAPIPTMTQVQLTPDMVQRFVASWPELETLGNELAEEYGVDESATDPTSAFGAWAQVAAAKAKIDAVLTKNGFSSLADWANTANSIMLARHYDPSQLDDEHLATAMEEIDNAPDLPPEQKEQIKAMVQQQFTMARSLTPLPGNVEVVAPFTDEIDAITGRDDAAQPN